MLDGLAGDTAFEGRLEEFEHFIVECLLAIHRVAEVWSEHQEGMARITHHCFSHQAEVAYARAVGGDRRLKGCLQCRGRGVELRGATDAADAWRDDERIFGIAPDQQLLEAAIHCADT